MSKTTKGKKTKIPKLTEAEYAEYISSLKTSDAPTEMPRKEEVAPLKEEKNSRE